MDYRNNNKNILFPIDDDKQIEGYKKYSNTLYEYCAFSNKKEAIKQRKFWNKVFRGCRLAPKVKSDIRGRVRSKKDEQFLSALFELFLYQFLHHIGLKVRSGNLLSGLPDFKVIHPKASNFYLEATCNMGDTLPDTEQGYRDRITDAIRSIQSNYFRVIVSYNGRCQKNPKLRNLKHDINEWLNQLDYELLLEKQKSSVLEKNQYEKIFDVDGLKVIIKPWPLKEPKSSKRYGLIYLGPMEGLVFVNTGKQLLKKLKAKEKQIRGARLPVIIAINEVAEYLDKDDMLTALFGELKTDIRLINMQPVDSTFRRGPSGIWLHNGKPINNSIEGVLFFNKIEFFTFPMLKPVMVLNPYIKNNRVPKDLKLIDYYIPSKDGLNMKQINKTDNDNWRAIWPFK